MSNALISSDEKVRTSIQFSTRLLEAFERTIAGLRQLRTSRQELMAAATYHLMGLSLDEQRDILLRYRDAEVSALEVSRPRLVFLRAGRKKERTNSD